MTSLQTMIVFQMDPLGDKVGGIQTFIRGFVRYAPDDFDIEFVGVTSDARSRPVGRWEQIQMEGRSVQFLPVTAVTNENEKGTLPLSLRLTAGILRHRRKIDTRRRVVSFHRIEPTLAFMRRPCTSILFLHGDPATDIRDPHAETKWSYFKWGHDLSSEPNSLA